MHARKILKEFLIIFMKFGCMDVLNADITEKISQRAS